MLELVAHAELDLARSGARFGEGCFETLRLQAGRPWRLAQHLARLAEGCAFLGLPEPPPETELSAFLAQHRIGRELPQGVLRLLAVDGTLRVWAESAPAPVGQPLSIGISAEVTRFSESPLNRFKTLSYLENRLLQREAAARGLFEVIALNEWERLTDGGRCSLFLQLEGRWVTPPVSEGALPGIAREALLEAGWAEVRSLRREAFDSAERAVLVNALRGAMPVALAEERPLASLSPEDAVVLEGLL